MVNGLTSMAGSSEPVALPELEVAGAGHPSRDGGISGTPEDEGVAAAVGQPQAARAARAAARAVCRLSATGGKGSVRI